MPAPIATAALLRAADTRQRGAAASTEQQTAARAAAGSIPDRNSDGMLLSSVHKAGEVGDKLFMADFMLPMLATGLAWTVGKLPFGIGARVRLFTDGILKAPLAAAKATTIGDITHLPAAYFNSMANTTSLEGAGKTFAGLSEKLGGVKSVDATHVAATGEFGAGSFQRFAAKRATAGLSGLHSEADAAMTALKSPAPNMFKRATRFFSSAPAQESAVDTTFATVEEAIAKFKGEIGREAHHVDVGAASKHLSDAKEALKNIAANPLHDKRVATMAEHLGGFEQRLAGIGNHLNSARGSQTLAQATATGIKNMSVFDVAFKGGMAAGSLYYTGRTIKNFKQAISGLQELYHDLTGEKIGFFGMITGHVPPLIAEARSNMFQRFLPEAMSAMASAGLNILWMRRHMGMREHVAMGAAMMTQMGVSELMPKENFLDSYLGIKDMQTAGQNVPAEAYAALIEGASADAREAGGVNSRLIQAMGADYAKEQKSAAAVLKEIQDKKPYMERAQRLALEVKKMDDVAKAGKVAAPATAAAPAPDALLQAGTGNQSFTIKHDGVIHQPAMHQERGV